MLTFMVRALIVSGLVSVAALLLERGLRHARAGARYAWTLAILASCALPYVPRLMSDRTATLNLPAVTLPTLVITASGGDRSIDYLLYGWGALSLVVALIYALAYWRLQRARSAWREEMVAQRCVYVSTEFGPAVFGFVRPRIVVPEWVRTTSHDSQRLIVLHESEHIRAGDQLQLLLIVLAAAWMPWNPFVWWQSRRLRFAVEADCDQRVLQQESSAARQYAQLLIDVGGRQKGLLVAAALAEHQNGLERRIGMIATRIAQNWWKAVALAAVSVGIGVVACESRLPTEQPQPQRQSAVELRRKISPNEPSFTPYTDMPMLENREDVQLKLVQAYPADLKKRGVGGMALMWVLVGQDGNVVNTKVKTSSGEPSLDNAAATVVKTMRFTPARDSGTPVPAWVVLPITFKTDGETAEQEPTAKAYTKEPVLTNRDEIRDLLIKAYPPALRDQGKGGKTIVAVLVGKSGAVENAKVKTSSGEPSLDDAAISVARALKFTPALDKDKPVAAWIAIPIQFTVH